MTERTYSIIGSMGRTATHWIAKSLNCHDDVFFAHGFDFDPRKDLTETVATSEARIDENVIGVGAFVSNPNHHDNYFDIVEKAGDYKVYGTIHNVLPIFEESSVSRRRNFTLSCIIRDPIRRIESFVRKVTKSEVTPFLDNPDGSPVQEFLRAERNRLDIDARKYGFRLDDLNTLVFLRSLNTMLIFDRDLTAVAQVFRMEDLVGNEAEYDRFFRSVTGLEPDSDPEFRGRKGAMEVQDNLTNFDSTHDDLVFCWEPWQARYMRDELDRHRMREFYENFRYDLSALDRAVDRQTAEDEVTIANADGLPAVTIIMFVRNRADMIGRAIDSVLDQNYPNLQFVIQDGASTDGTVEIVGSYGDRIELVSEPDRDTNDGFWRGLMRARGDIIGTCLSDEEMMPGSIVRAVREFERRPRAGAITGDAIVADVVGNTVGFHTGSDFDLLSYLLCDYCPHFATSFFRRQALIDIGFFSDRWRVDGLDTVEFELWCRLGTDHVVDYVPHLFARWTVHDEQMSQNVDRIANELASRTALLDRYMFGDGNFMSDIDGLRGLVIKRQHDVIIYHLIAHEKRGDAFRIEALRTAALGAEAAGPSMAEQPGLPQPPGELSPDEKIHRGRLFHEVATRYRDRGQVDEALKVWRGADVLNDETIDAMQPQLSLASPTITDAELEARQVAWAHKFAHPTQIVLHSALKDISTGKKLTVAYNSTLWNIQTGLAILLPVMAAHDRSKIKLIGYSHIAQPPEVREKFDEFYETGPINHGGFAEMVRSHGVDIFIETNGLSYGNRLPAMAARCAPVQVSYVNHAGTLAVPNVDFVMTDACTAESMDPGYYTERFHILDSCFLSYTYAEMPAPVVSPPPFDVNNHITFGCFGGPYKLNLECLKLWAGALHAVPRSRIVIQNTGMTNPSSADFVRKRLGRLGIRPDRITLLPGDDREVILQNYCMIDISLDSWPYCGGNTIAEALWQGVPVVTLKGDRFVSGYGASLLESAGIGDLVAHDPEEFALICAHLAADVEKLRDLRRDLRSMMVENGMSDPIRMARSLEKAYAEMSRIASL